MLRNGNGHFLLLLAKRGLSYFYFPYEGDDVFLPLLLRDFVFFILRSGAVEMQENGREEMEVLQGCGAAPEVLRASLSQEPSPFKKACGIPQQ